MAKTTSSLSNPTPEAIVYLTNANDSVDVRLYWRYDQGRKKADHFAIFWKATAEALTHADSSVLVAITSRVYTFHGLPHGRAYAFGVASVKGPTVGPIIQSHYWTDVYAVSSLQAGDIKKTQKDIAGIQGQVGQIVSHFGSLGKRLGFGLEHVVRGIVKEFAGKDYPHVAPLVLRDEEGEVFGSPKAQVEFDLYAHSDSVEVPAYLVEIKSHLKKEEVLIFHKKVKFAEKELGRSVIPLILALSMKKGAASQLKRLKIKSIIAPVIE